MWVWKSAKEKESTSWSSQTLEFGGGGSESTAGKFCSLGSKVRVRESSKKPLYAEQWRVNRRCHEAGRAFQAQRTKCTVCGRAKECSKFREGNQQCWPHGWRLRMWKSGRDRPRGLQGPGKCELKRKVGYWPFARKWPQVTLSGQSHSQ